MKERLIGLDDLGEFQPKNTKKITLAELDLDPELAQEAMNFLNARKYFFVMVGCAGSGKTTLGIAMGMYFLKKYTIRRTVKINSFEEIEKYTPTAFYLPTRSYFKELQEAMDPNSRKNDGQIKEKYFTSEFLFIDDIGIGTNREWEVKTLHELLDERYSSELPTVASSNLSMEEISRIFHSRFASRLEDARNWNYRDWELDRRKGPNRR